MTKVIPLSYSDSNDKIVSSQSQIIQRFLKRESISSTGIGEGVALPHLRHDGLKEPIAWLVLLKKGLPFNAVDGIPCKIFFLFITPSDQTSTHLQILAKISGLLGNRQLRWHLEKAESPEKVYQILWDEEEHGKQGYINLER